MLLCTAAEHGWQSLFNREGPAEWAQMGLLAVALVCWSVAAARSGRGPRRALDAALALGCFGAMLREYDPGPGAAGYGFLQAALMTTLGVGYVLTFARPVVPLVRQAVLMLMSSQGLTLILGATLVLVGGLFDRGILAPHGGARELAEETLELGGYCLMVIPAIAELSRSLRLMRRAASPTLSR